MGKAISLIRLRPLCGAGGLPAAGLVPGQQQTGRQDVAPEGFLFCQALSQMVASRLQLSGATSRAASQVARRGGHRLLTRPSLKGALPAPHPSQSSCPLRGDTVHGADLSRLLGLWQSLDRDPSHCDPPGPEIAGQRRRTPGGGGRGEDRREVGRGCRAGAAQGSRLGKRGGCACCRVPRKAAKVAAVSTSQSWHMSTVVVQVLLATPVVTTGCGISMDGGGS